MSIKYIRAFVVLLLLASCSSTPPVVYHEQYGEMSADNELFTKDGLSCAKEGESNTLDIEQTHILEVDLAIIAAQYYLFFSGTSSCIHDKGWVVISQ